MATVSLKKLEKRYGATSVVHGIDLDVADREFIALVGPSGCGKSTTLRMIAGFLEPDAGDAIINGASVLSQRTRAQLSLGYLAEGAPLYLDLVVRDFLGFLARTHGLSKQAAHQAIARVAEDAAITEVISRRIETLSKGYRRRVALAGAIVHDPPVLILDEPTDGLDPNQKIAMRSLIARMSADKAILISTHQLDEVEAMCSRAVLIAGGEVRADATPADLARRAPSGKLEDAFHMLTRTEKAA